MPPRNPDETRMRILEAALEEIHLRGFQGMRVEHILKRTGLTKGALYHHFANKMAIGYAIVDEILEQTVLDTWVAPLSDATNPVLCIIKICQEEAQNSSAEEIEKGCPINNLTQEMSPIDEGFRERLEGVYRVWAESITLALQRGQKQGIIRPNLNPANVALFLLASLQGIIGIAKCHKDEQALVNMGECLREYLYHLQTPEVQSETAYIFSSPLLPRD